MNVYSIMTDAELKHIIDTARGRLVHDDYIGEVKHKKLMRDYVGGYREIKRRKRRGMWSLHTDEVVRADEKFETPYILYPFMTLYRRKYRLHPDEATARQYRADRARDYENATIFAWDEKSSAWVKLK